MKYITFTTEGSLPLCQNLLISAKNVGIENNMTVYCLDENSFNSLKDNFSCEVKLYDSKEIRSNFHEYGKDDFREVTSSKIKIIQKELEENDSLVYTDCDVVFAKDPTPSINHFNENHGKDVDIFFSTDHPFMNICTGFMYIKDTSSVHDLFARYFELNDYYHSEGSDCMYDQEIINQILEKGTIKNLKWKIYPLDFVCNGHVYFNEPEDGMTTFSKTGRESVIHCNFCVGIENKISRFKRESLWNLKEEAISEKSN